VTTQAPLRSRWTKAESVYHVRERVTGILSHLLVKIQGTGFSIPPQSPLPLGEGQGEGSTSMIEHLGFPHPSPLPEGEGEETLSIA
jgi:hypothetical protein